MDKIVIVMPAWNEAGNIKEMIDVLVKTEFPKIDADVELLVVDNHSTDGMTEVVESASKKHKNVHIVQQEGKGLGWAYVTGLKYAMEKLKADGVLEMDADFQHPPRFVKPMVDAYLSGADYVIGSRYIKGGSVPGEWAFSRKFVSFFGNLFIRICLVNFKIHDLTTGFRLTRVKGVLEEIDLNNLMELNRFAYKVDLLYQSLKLSKKTVEVPLEFAARTKEKSKFNYKEMISTFKVAIILGIKDKQRFVKFGFVGFVGYLINAFGLEFFYRVLHFPAGVAAGFGAELAIISNFTFNNLWTFSEKKISGVGMLVKKFIQFNLTSVGAVIIQTVVVGLGTRFFGDDRRQIMLLIAVVFFVLPFNYAAYNILIWKTWKVPGLGWLQKLVG